MIKEDAIVMQQCTGAETLAGFVGMLTFSLSKSGLGLFY
jgi:hypothetical protein